MEQLKKEQRLDLHVSEKNSDSKFSTDYLFGESRGQMFGIMECEGNNGNILALRAFSGQYNGAWYIKGWVPPLINIDEFDKLVSRTDKKIKFLGKEIEKQTRDVQRQRLKAKRKRLSQELMKDIHKLYTVYNFRSETAKLSDFFSGGIPTGSGDCCAPKLLNYAIQNNLKPLSLAEFYWGKENKSKTRKHGVFYSSCKEKCQPILGFMLCGL